MDCEPAKLTEGNAVMHALERGDLYSLETYAEKRPEFRAKVMAHKKNRILRLDEHASLHFEDRLTIQYQVQEMLRAEKIFEADGISEELEAYNPLIPDGSNLKATFMLEYDDAQVRARELAKLVGIEDRVWLRVDGFEPVWAIADEDLDRSTDEKTSSVHFLRFELAADMAAAFKQGAPLAVGIDHEHYQVELAPVPENIRASLTADLA